MQQQAVKPNRTLIGSCAAADTLAAAHWGADKELHSILPVAFTGIRLLTYHVQLSLP